METSKHILLGNSGLGLFFGHEVLLEFSHEGALLGAGLEATVSVLGAGVDPLEVDLLEGEPLRLGDERFTEGDGASLGSNTGSTDHDEVLVDHSIVWEATHRVDGLLGDIVVCGTVLLAFRGNARFSNTVDLLVHFGTVVEALLTSSSNSELNSGRMPSSNTSDLAETLVGLARQFLGVPTAGNSLESVTLGYTNGVDHLVLSKDIVDGNLLLEMLAGPVDLVRDGTSVNLDLHNMSFTLTVAHNAHLSVSDDTDNRAILLDLV